MYIFGYKKRLIKLLSLPENQKYSMTELYKYVSEKVESLLNEYVDLIGIVEYTSDIEKFIKCNSRILEIILELKLFEDYVKFLDQTPSDILDNYYINEQTIIKNFLNRSSYAYSEIAKKYSKVEDRISLYNEYYNLLAPCVLKMNDDNIKYLKEYCRDKIINSFDITVIESDKNRIITEESVGNHKRIINKVINSSGKTFKRYVHKQKKSDDIQTRDSAAKDTNESYRSINKILLYDIVSKEIIDNNKQELSNVSTSGFRCIYVDYSDNGYYFCMLQNMIIPKLSIKNQHNFIDNLIKYANPDSIKLILFTETTYYSEYIGIPHLYLPIITELSGFKKTVNNILLEVDSRKRIFAEYNCKDIKSYNSLINNDLKKKELPYIVFIVQETSFLSDLNDIEEQIISLLSVSKIYGIYMYFFSELSDRDICISSRTDLLKIGNNKDLKSIFSKSDNLLELSDIIENIDGIKFETLCGELLKSDGYTNIQITKPSGDYGADIIAEKDYIKYAIQCKRYSNKVGISAIQEVMGSKSIYNCHVAVVFTNSYFTKSAIELAKRNNVLLWDGNKLSSMIEKNKEKIKFPID